MKQTRESKRVVWNPQWGRGVFLKRVKAGSKGENQRRQTKATSKKVKRERKQPVFCGHLERAIEREQKSVTGEAEAGWGECLSTERALEGN